MSDEPADVIIDQLIEEAGEAEPSPRGLSQLDWHIYSNIKKAIIMDPDITKCQCFVKEDKRACFADGALGVLSEEQLAQYKEVETLPMSDEMAQLMEAAESCTGIPKDWLSCVAKSRP